MTYEYNHPRYGKFNVVGFYPGIFGQREPLIVEERDPGRTKRSSNVHLSESQWFPPVAESRGRRRRP